MRPEGTGKGKHVSWTVLVALFVVPLLVVGSLIGLATSQDEDKISAAIVNLDEGTEIDGQPVPMGRQLAAEIMEREGANIEWILADEASGNEGLETGEYAAVVTIPANFSEAAMSFAANDAEQAEQARIDVTISRNAPAGDASLAQEIARIATSTLNDMLTSQYLDGIYIGFNEVGDQFGQIVDGARQLDDGAGQLADGLREASDGTGELVDGAEQLSAASDELNDGGEQLADSGTELADGARQLADGAGELDAGVQEMAGQMQPLTDGVSQLADGAEQLLPGVAQYADGTTQVIDGVDQLADGLDQVVQGLDSADMDTSQMQPLVDGSQELADGADQLADGIDQFVSAIEPLEDLVDDETIATVAGLQEQVDQLSDFATNADEQLRGLASGEAPLPPEVQALSTQLKAQFECTVDDEALCEQMRAAYEQGVDASLESGVREGASAATQLLNATEPSTGETYLDLISSAGDELSGTIDQAADGLAQAQQIIPQLQEMRDGARDLADGNQQLADGIAQLVNELPAQIQAQMGELRSGLVQLRDGADEIVTQAQPLVDNGEQLADGSNQLLAGIQELASQLGLVPAGVNQLADGTSQLADGASELNDGVGQYTDGILAYVDGVWQYTDGVDQLAVGAPELADGLGQLADGADELADGTETFASELESGQEQVPTYSESDRERLSEVVSSPVAGNDDLMAKGNVALSALILSVGVWLAALAAFTVTRTVPSTVVTSGRSSTALWARTIAVPTGIVAAVGLVLGVVGGVMLDLSVGRTFGLIAILVLLGLVFSLVHHALAGWLGHVGRGISLVLLAATIALGLSSAVPGWLGGVASISPLQSGMVVTRSWLAGAEVATSIAVLLLVAIVAAAISWTAIGMRRQLSPAQYRLQQA